MNTKTLLTAVVGGFVGLALAMGTMVFAQNTGHMGQTTQKTMTNQNTHDSMHGNTVAAQMGGMMGQTTPKTTKSLTTYDSMHGKTAATQMGGMMGQTTPQTTNNLNTHALMHGTTAKPQTEGMMGAAFGNMHQQAAPVAAHHSGFTQPAQNTLCHGDTVAKSGDKA